MQPFMNKGPRVFPVLLLAAVFAGSCTAVHCALAAPNAEDTNLYAQYSSAFAEELQQLAVECEQAGEEDLAKRIRNWLPQRALDKIYLFHPGPPATTVGGDSQLADKFQQLCQQHGEDLLELALSNDGLGGEGGGRPLRLIHPGHARHVVRVRPEWSSTVAGRFRELTDDRWSLWE